MMPMTRPAACRGGLFHGQSATQEVDMREALPESEHEYKVTEQGDLLVCRHTEGGLAAWERFKLKDLLPPLDAAQQ